MSGEFPNRPPDPPLPRADDELDRPLLSYMPAPGSNLKNWRLEGTGFSPVTIYVVLFGLLGVWLVGACLLSFLGPLVMLLLVAMLFGATWFYSQRIAEREQRVGMGLCPKCGFDLRCTESQCPECGTPVPEEIQRRRRSMQRMKARLGIDPSSDLPPAAATAPPLARLAPPTSRPVDRSPIPLVDWPESPGEQPPEPDRGGEKA